MLWVMLYSFAILPPPSISSSLSDIRMQLDPEHGAKTVPHITLKQPFELGLDRPHGLHRPVDEAQLVACIRIVCARMSPFSVTLTDVGVFDSSSFGSVVHYRVELSSALAGLHSALVHAVSALGIATCGVDVAREEQLFYPHLTLAQGLTSERGRELTASMHGRVGGSFRVSELVVGRRNEDQVWERPHVLPFAPTLFADATM